MESSKEICRLCMAKNQLSNIFRLQDGIGLDHKAMACTVVKINMNDGLPSLICKTCEFKLHIFYKFKVQCEDTDFKLKEVFKSQNLKCDTEKQNNNERLKVKDPHDPVIEVKCEPDIVSDYDDCFSVTREIIEYSDFVESVKSVKHKQARNKNRKDKSNKNKYHVKAFRIKKSKVDSLLKESIERDKTIISKDLDIDKESSDIKNTLFPNAVDFDLTNKLNQKPLKPFQCELCGLTFKLKSILKKHMTTHSDEKSFACTLCPKRYTRAEHRVVHMRLHTGVRPYICEICARSFVKNQDLVRHSRIHSDEKKYPCPRCDRKFKRSGDVHAHMRTHTGVRPFVCKYCSKAYTSHSGLRKHRPLCKRYHSDISKNDINHVKNEQI